MQDRERPALVLPEAESSGVVGTPQAGRGADGPVKWHLGYDGGYFIEKASPKVAEYWARIERWLRG